MFSRGHEMDILKDSTPKLSIKHLKILKTTSLVRSIIDGGPGEITIISFSLMGVILANNFNSPDS